MVKAYAVIGANYGDEGKGLVTDFLCREAKASNKVVLNILTNGGCQRGHTVVDENNNRFVFSHLGSGFNHADIYFSKYYMINPMVFCEELNRFNKLYEIENTIFVDQSCTLTTPYDMYVNRIVENRRTNKHGSCGYGIWETVKRNKVYPLYWYNISTTESYKLKKSLMYIRDTYYSKVLRDYNIKLTDSEKEIFYSDTLLDNYINDVYTMYNKTITVSFDLLVDKYDVLVFENAQGLLLDMELGEWTTPSKTGMTYIDEMIKPYQIDITPYYVTRSYLTKHGYGLFPGECEKDNINKSIDDKTNCPNDYQGTLRYGRFDGSSARLLYDRIKFDAGEHDFKLVVTHVNEYTSVYLSQYADFYSDNERTIIKDIIKEK